jgi:DNA-binding XRE family transcriptional regulator
MNYSKAIKDLRNKMLLTQTEFAKTIGTSFGSVNRWENGKYIPTMKMKRKLDYLFKKYHVKIEEN